MSRINVLGVSFDNVVMDEALEIGLEAISQHSGGYVVTPNPEIVMAARDNSSLNQALAQALLVLPDGIGVIYGAKILGTPLKERVPGIDFSYNLMHHLAGQQGTVYLLGAKPGIAEMAGKNLADTFPGLQIVGTHDGYFTDDEPIVTEINSLKPDLLLVCLGFPKQELWMQKNMHRVDVGLMAGLGGSLDVFAGAVQRAPVMWQKLGFEWLYRLLKEPWRIGRMMRLPKFLLYAIKERVKK